ncbi:MAG: methyltransferase family protein [Sciscionella sp.]
MRKSAAALGSTAFFVAGPSLFMGVLPWRWTRWVVRRRYPWPVRSFGVSLIGAGTLIIASAFTRFVREGMGTPLPVAAPERLVVGGMYRHVRNPMYVAGEATLLGQALVLGQPKLLLYVAGVAIPAASFVHWYEEPALRRRFGVDYEIYRRSVPGWVPRVRPWTGSQVPHHQ